MNNHSIKNKIAYQESQWRRLNRILKVMKHYKDFQSRYWETDQFSSVWKYESTGLDTLDTNDSDLLISHISSNYTNNNHKLTLLLINI